MSSPVHSPVQAVIGIVATIPGYFVTKWLATFGTMTPDQFTAWTVAICGAVYTIGWTLKSLHGLIHRPEEPMPNGESYRKPRHRKSHETPEDVL